MGRGFLDGFAADMVAILSPGVIGSRGLGEPDLAIEGFGIGNLRLAGGFVVDGVG
jgi:hypothetical protein